MNNKKLTTVLLALLGCFFSTDAFAATRTVYFTQVGRNVVRNGLGQTAAATCRVTISNPSGQSQSFTFTPSMTATGSGTPPNNATPTGAINGTLNVGDAPLTYTFTYPSVPASTPNAAQEVVCSGTVVATDGAQPGFLLASGVLITFVESGEMETEGTTTAIYGGMAVYTQVPVAINRGQPF